MIAHLNMLAECLNAASVPLGDEAKPLQALLGKLQEAVAEECSCISQVRN